MNRFVLQTDATLYHYRCPQKTPVVGKLEAGCYVIDVDARCILDANTWMLQGIHITETNYTLTYPPPPPIPINLTWFSFPEHENDTFQIRLTKGINKIEVPTYADLQALPESTIVQEINTIQANIGINPLPWWAWLIIAVIVIIALICILKYVAKFMPCCLKRTHPNLAVAYNPENQTIRVTDNVQQVGFPEEDVAE